MLKKTLIATAAAATIAGGALALSATGASAAPYYGSGYGGGYGGYPQHQVCRPITKTVRWIDRWGHPHFVTKVVGQKCTPAPLPPYHPPFAYPHHPWGWGW
jgi:hypothetical protein